MSTIASTISMPTSILTTWSGVKINDGVNTFCGTDIHDTVDKLEAFLFDRVWGQIVYEVAMVDRDSNTIKTQ